MEQQIQSPESRMDETKRWRGEGGGGGLMMHQVSVKPSASSLVILHFNVN